ncbi:hypothetical protein MPTK1_2g10320 [Marchantia polymorpha subsp. ruderalis]|uniref:Uncharacterized protein n=1 Tax=Marchantia polymorpha TaxID=3197 RepID=A0A2R6XC24_MARPO|nr:hypothetical protein MARPO_0023s0002 [Marchantia polymorpha]BBN01795.1 hypothetical protein Mp_2g10320 [Marchantia polymorpha subsp. ruderalis]|eukprot:PTQ43658.1 hypothetical protein MARPO_0023s0002 [Marchantia polymorpha]
MAICAIDRARCGIDARKILTCGAHGVSTCISPGRRFFFLSAAVRQLTHSLTCGHLEDLAQTEDRWCNHFPSGVQFSSTALSCAFSRLKRRHGSVDRCLDPCTRRARAPSSLLHPM